MRPSSTCRLAILILIGGACGDVGGGGGDVDGGGEPRPDAGGGLSTAAEVAGLLGRDHFLIGMGNDLAADHSQDGAYTLGVTMDLHYCYLVGLPGQGGWPDWNTDGSFVNIMTDSAAAQGTVPMFTLYAMASWGDGNLAGLSSADFMGPYWDGVRLLYQRLAIFDGPAVVHLEPDFWAYAEQQSGGDPAGLTVLVSIAPECSDLPDDLSGLGRCLMRMGRQLAPKAVIGLHASRWAGAPGDMVAFLSAVGAGEGDFIGADLLDRDAGCFEEHVDPNCQRTDGPWYWDESNATSPNFHESWDWSGQITQGLGKPMLWWQVPFGVPSDTYGGAPEHYRDNRVHYIFLHLDELLAAGGLGVAFGTGAGNQTYITTDGGHFQDAVTAYFADPVPFP